MPLCAVHSVAVHETPLVELVHGEIGDVRAAIGSAPRVFGERFGGDADQAVLVDVDRQRVQAREKHVHPQVELEADPYGISTHYGRTG